MEEPKYQLGTRAVVFLPICDHHPVAAAILAYVISFAEFYDRVNAYEPFTVEVDCDGVYDYRANPDAYKTFGYNVSPHLFYLCPSLKDLRDEVFFSFAHPPGTISDTMLWEALNLLQKKGLLDYYSAIESKKELFDYCGVIEFEKEIVYLDYHKCTENVDAALIKWYAGTIEIVHHPHPILNSERERKRVRNQCLRAEQAGQSSTLTVEEWLQTLTYFMGKCAFSSRHPY